jgi:hypothetical protein
MTQKSIAATLVRLFAIGLIIYAFRNAGTAIYFISRGHAGLSDLYMLFAGIAVPVIAAGLLWILPDKVAGTSRPSADIVEEHQLNAQIIFSIGVALIGLYLAATAMASVFHWALSYREQKSMMGAMLEIPSANYISLYSDLFLLFIGILFFFGSSAISKAFTGLRRYGVGTPDSPY